MCRNVRVLVLAFKFVFGRPVNWNSLSTNSMCVKGKVCQDGVCVCVKGGTTGVSKGLTLAPKVIPLTNVVCVESGST